MAADNPLRRPLLPPSSRLANGHLRLSGTSTLKGDELALVADQPERSPRRGFWCRRTGGLPGPGATPGERQAPRASPAHDTRLPRGESVRILSVASSSSQHLCKLPCSRPAAAHIAGCWSTGRWVRATGGMALPGGGGGGANRGPLSQVSAVEVLAASAGGWSYEERGTFWMGVHSCSCF